METTQVLQTAMRNTGPWYGPNGTRNKYAYDVLFAAEQHVTREDNPRAAEWLATRKVGNSVAWLERAL